MVKYRVRIERKPSKREAVGCFVFDVFVGLGLTAIGIGLFGKRKAAKVAKKGGNCNE